MGSSLAQGHGDRASPLLHKQKTMGNRCVCAGVSVVVLQFFCTHCVLQVCLCVVVGAYGQVYKGKRKGTPYPPPTDSINRSFFV